MLVNETDPVVNVQIHGVDCTIMSKETASTISCFGMAS